MNVALNMIVSMACVLGLLGFSGEAQAMTIEVKVLSIEAQMSEPAQVDPKLSALAPKLRSGFKGYTQFTLLRQDVFQLQVNGTKTLKLPNGTSMSYAFQGINENFIKLGLSVVNKMSTTLRATSGSTFFHAGLKIRGGLMVLAISVDVVP